jgi:1D-myo-inositol 3-kinase
LEDFLAAGHVVQDLTSDSDPGAWRLGGAVSYASTLAVKLGLSAAALTAASPDLDLAALLPGVHLHVVPGERTTAIRHVYEGGRRRQYLPRRAATLRAEHLPPEWAKTPVVLLGPVAGEIDSSLAAGFPRSLVGLGAQGWLREAGPDTEVHPIPPAKWDARPLLHHARVLFLSDEDVLPEESAAALEAWSRMVEIVAFTRGERGAEVCVRREWRRIEAFPARPIDLTGAGDVFAAAFLVSLHQRGDPWEAARFASAAASLVIEGLGIDGVPGRRQIEQRLREHPEIVAR